MAGQYGSYPILGVPVYPSFAAFPVTASNGSLAIDGSTDTLYIYSTMNMAWEAIGGTSVPLGIGTINSQPPSANALVIANNLLYAQIASSSVVGMLTAADWTTFNNKQPSGSYITALTGDVTASGPGSAAASLVATSNSTLTTLSALTTATSLSTIGTQSQALNMGSHAITSVSNPTNPQDAATKFYVDNVASGISWKLPVEAFSNTNVPLTGSTPLVIDGYTVLNGDSVILSNQTTTSQQGVYTVSIVVTTYTLTLREIAAIGDAYLVLKGTMYAYDAFVVSSITPTVYTQFSGPTEYSFSAPLVQTGTTVSITQSSGSTNGYLSSTDWNTFNNKQPAGSYITALTGDVTASGPGSSATTLATVNASPGSFTYASLTVNGKGLVTAASSGAAPVTTLSAVGVSPNANAGTITGSTLNLQPFDSTHPGVVTASGGGTTNFLRADGTWAVPSTSVAASISAKAYLSSTITQGANTQINFDTVLFDTNAAITTGASWAYKVPVAGKYLVSVITDATSFSGTPDLSIYINGSNDTYLYSYAGSAERLSGSSLFNLSVNDTIDARFSATITTLVGSTAPYQTSISISFQGS